MRRTWAVFVSCSLLLVFLSSCVVHADRAVKGSGRVSEEVHKLRGFSGVKFATIGNLHIKKGRREELRVEAEENLHDYFECEVSDGVLEIKNRRNVNIRPRKEVHFYLTVRELDEIVLSGCGNIDAPDLEGRRIRLAISGSGNLETGDLEADEIMLKISGSGNLIVGDGETDEVDISITGSGNIGMRSLDAKSARLKISGSGNAKISRGSVGRQSIVITGSGHYKAKQLGSSDADVMISGSGTATIKVEDHLEARISGSGDVRYAGRPSVRAKVSGSGDLDRI